MGEILGELSSMRSSAEEAGVDLEVSHVKRTGGDVIRSSSTRP